MGNIVGSLKDNTEEYPMEEWDQGVDRDCKE